MFPSACLSLTTNTFSFFSPRHAPELLQTDPVSFFRWFLFRLGTLHSLLEDAVENSRVIVSAQIAPVLLR